MCVRGKNDISRAEQSRAEQSRAEQSRAERNYGIDLLRIVCMFYVVILHIQGFGGVRSACTSVVSASVVTFIRTICFCAVNCYALISGYVGYTNVEKKYRYSKYIEMWMQVVFYGVLGSTMFLIISPDVLYLKHFILAFFPVTCDQWWYFTAYTGLFFLIPWLNKFVRLVPEKELTKLVILVVTIFSVYPTLASLYKEPFGLMAGYSMLWLIIMYLIGAWLKKNSIVEKMDKNKTLIWGIIAVGVTWLTKLVFELSGDASTLFLQSYVSPTIIYIAIAHLKMFSQLRINPKFQKCIAFFAPAAFGVYLFHMQWDILDNAITGKMSFISSLPVWKLPIAILIIALVITVMGLLIDKARIYIFQALKVRQFADLIERKLEKQLSDRI